MIGTVLGWGVVLAVTGVGILTCAWYTAHGIAWVICRLKRIPVGDGAVEPLELAWLPDGPYHGHHRNRRTGETP